MIYALDSNTISYMLRGEGNVLDAFKRESTRGNQYTIPFVVVHEIKRWLLYKSTKILQDYNREFDSLFKPIEHRAEMPLSVWEKATDIHISLKRTGQLIGSADILIAAYCLVNDYTLVTRNISDFGCIGGLKLVDWY